MFVFFLHQNNLNCMIPDLLIWIVCVFALIIAFIWLPISEYFYVQSAFPKAAVTSGELYAEQDEVRNFFFVWWIVGFLSGLYIGTIDRSNIQNNHSSCYTVFLLFSVVEWFFTSVKICLFKSMKEGSVAPNQGNGPTNAVWWLWVSIPTEIWTEMINI